MTTRLEEPPDTKGGPKITVPLDGGKKIERQMGGEPPEEYKVTKKKEEGKGKVHQSGGTNTPLERVMQGVTNQESHVPRTIRAATS